MKTIGKLVEKWKYKTTIPSVVDQREIQEICPECRKHPTSCFMRLLAEILEIENASVLDLTYGIGEFYRYWRPSYLVAFDIRKWDWVATPDEFYEAPFWEAPNILGEKKFDVVVFDPPYDVVKAISTRTWLYYGKENLGTILQNFPKIAKKYATKYIIAKFMDGRKYTVFDLVSSFGQKPKYVIIYRFVYYRRPTKHNKIIKTHVYYLIWKV